MVWSSEQGPGLVLGESAAGNGPVGGGEQRRRVGPPRSAFPRLQTRPRSLRGGRLRRW